VHFLVAVKYIPRGSEGNGKGTSVIFRGIELKFARGARARATDGIKSLIIAARIQPIINRPLHRMSNVLSTDIAATQFLRDKLHFAARHRVKRMKDGAIIFQFPAGNFSDNIDYVLNAR